MEPSRAISAVQAAVFFKMTGVRAPFDRTEPEPPTAERWAKWNEWCAKDNAAAVRITFLSMMEKISD